MADIRINSLPSTATSFNTDDYIPLDGASGGTRKMLAATLPLTDVKFGGASGPSAKASIAARAARQGLVQDGTSGSSVSIPAMGTSDFSFVTWINIRDYTGINGITSGANGSFALYITSSTGLLNVDKRGTAAVGTSTSAVPTGKFVCVGYVRSGSTGTFYIDGVAAGTATDSQNYTVATSFYGAINPITQDPLRGTLLAPYAYNRALTAAEVVSLYESGVPAGADYNNASNTSIIPASDSTFDNAIGGNWKVALGSPTISGGKLTVPDGAATYFYMPASTLGRTFSAGQKVRFTVTVDSITAGNARYYNGSAYVNFASASGTYTVEFTMLAASHLYLSASGGQAVFDGYYAYALGLLLAPDAAQAGGGLTWYDTSGNAANITLPASGVSWNVPTSSKTATGWTFGGTVATTGNLAVSGTGHSSFAGPVNIAGQVSVITGSRTMVDYTTDNNVRLLGFGPDASTKPGFKVFLGTSDNSSSITPLQITPSGNALWGTSTDSGNGRIQLANHNDKTGGLGFYTDTSLYRVGTGYLGLSALSGTTGGLRLFENTTQRSQIAYSGSDTYVDATTGNLILRSNNVEFLRGDSSQNATFAGKVVAQSSTSGTARIMLGQSSGTGWGVNAIEVNDAGGGLFAAYNAGTPRGYLWADSTGIRLTSYSNYDTIIATGGTGKIYLNAKINASTLPTSSSGLASGDLWVDTAAGNVVKRV